MKYSFQGGFFKDILFGVCLVKWVQLILPVQRWFQRGNLIQELYDFIARLILHLVISTRKGCISIRILLFIADGRLVCAVNETSPATLMTDSISGVEFSS